MIDAARLAAILTADGNPLLRLGSVSMEFSTGRATVEALRDITFDLPKGEFVTIVGASGCGKSTLLKLVAGLLQPTSGSIARQPELEVGTGIGMVFQDPVLLPWRTVLNNVLLPTEILHLKGAKPAALSLIEEVGLGGFEAAHPHQLSGGMQQRVAICRALLPDPPLLLMDEPFGALDAITRERMNLQLQHIWSEHRKTILLVTHSIEESIFLSDRIIVMTPRPGRIRAIIDNELERPRSVATYGTARFAQYATKIREMIVDPDTSTS